jgi:hypothetical protein
VAALVAAAPAHGAATVTATTSAWVVTFDPVAQDNLSVTATDVPNRVRFTDTAGIVAGDLEPGTCSPITSTTLECVRPAIRSTLRVNAPSKPGPTPDVIDASASPLRLALGVLSTISNEVDVIGSPGADTIRLEAGSASRVRAGDGNDTIVGTWQADQLDGGPGNDIISAGDGADDIVGGPGDDAIDGGPGVNTVSYAGHGAAVNVNLADARADGAEGEQDALAAIQNLVGSSGDDTLVGDAGANDLHGGAGRDVIIGQAGSDRLFGGAGDDDVRATDGETDVLDCGEGADHASHDDIDLAANCDDSIITVLDRDGDGAPSYLDCDDRNAAVRPGAVDVPGDGIDQDCTSGDARVDADGDGVFREDDCDDGNAAIKPGAMEIPGNRVDEDCRSGPAAYPLLDSAISATYVFQPRYTAFTGLLVRRARRGSTVQVRCSGRGCRFRSKSARVRRDRRELRLSGLIQGMRLRPGTRLEIRVTRPRTVGLVARFTVRAGKPPLRRDLCVQPGARRPERCPL